MKKEIDNSHINLLELMLPTFIVASNLQNVNQKEIFSIIINNSKEILKEFNLKENDLKSNELKKEVIKNLSSMMAANIIYSKDLNLSSMTNNIKEVLNNDLIDEITIKNSNRFDKSTIGIIIIPIYKEIKQFHLSLFYSDYLKKEEVFKYDENLINYILNSILKIKNNTNEGSFLEYIKLHTKIYTMVLNIFFENILKNDKIINEYKKNQKIFIEELDINYKQTLKEFEKSIEIITR